MTKTALTGKEPHEIQKKSGKKHSLRKNFGNVRRKNNKGIDRINGNADTKMNRSVSFFLSLSLFLSLGFWNENSFLVEKIVCVSFLHFSNVDTLSTLPSQAHFFLLLTLYSAIMKI
jgi:hypothetical protein